MEGTRVEDCKVNRFREPVVDRHSVVAYHVLQDGDFGHYWLYRKGCGAARGTSPVVSTSLGWVLRIRKAATQNARANLFFTITGAPELARKRKNAKKIPSLRYCRSTLEKR